MNNKTLDLTNTTKAFDLYGKEVIKRAKRNLKIKKKVDGKYITADGSGKLGKSLKYKLVFGNNKINLKFVSKVPYADFMEEGVRGSGKFSPDQKHQKIKQSSKKSEYKFTGRNIKSGVLKDWIKSPKMKLRNKEGKFIAKTPKNIQNAEFTIGRSIATSGLSARHYMRSAIEESKKRFVLNLKEGLLKDLTTGINIK